MSVGHAFLTDGLVMSSVDLSANERNLRIYIDQLPLPLEFRETLLALLDTCLNEVGTDVGNFINAVCCETCLLKVSAVLEGKLEEPS
jgi:hypothetical protein